MRKHYNKIQELKNACNDDLFMEDLNELVQDFNIIDYEEWPES